MGWKISRQWERSRENVGVVYPLVIKLGKELGN
jgi:hypothetical protein